MKTLSGPVAEVLKACRSHFVATAVFSALLNLLYLTPTLFMLQVYDRVVPTGGLLTLFYLTIAVILALATLAGLDMIRARLMTLAGLRLDRLLAPVILRRLIVTRAGSAQGMRDFDLLRQALSGPTALAVLDAPWIPIYLIIAFALHPAIGGMALAGAVVLLFLAVLNERATRVSSKASLEAQAAAYAAQDAAARNAEVVRSLGMERAMEARQLDQRAAGLDMAARTQMAGGAYSAAIKFARLTLQSLALALGAWLAVERQISAGAIIASSVLISRALQPVEQIVGAWGLVSQARNSFSNIISLLDASGDRPAGTALPVPDGDVRLEQIVVRGREGQLLLRGASLRLVPGEILGVLGPSGAGKTTLARVAAGALTPDAGTARIDQANYADWEPDRLGRFIGYLPQDPSLMAGSVRDNISRFAGWIGDDAALIDAETVNAAKAAGAHELILRLPHGYDTELGVGGRGLSAGQAQRIALARALYGAPPVLVLDEPNSALDADGETALANALVDARRRGCAIMIIAHRSGILGVADRLAVLRDGQIERMGARDKVIAALNAATAAPKPKVVKP
ncbi:type I secretion system permease/ATPase [Caulobacter radicis]|uniref:type I secretion system permease/ATPase n=1 Tax=Caulobacter radicis TaxID=2172650 RepID=UPI001FCC129F|nr:type I secretion system permease/ATPase [Caulobacter radicis]